MHKPSSVATGVRGYIGTAPQTVATTKYSVGTAFQNTYGDRYARVVVKCDKVFTLYIYGSKDSFSSTANDGATTGVFIDSYSGHAATSGNGCVFWYPIAGFKYVLPVLYQSSGSNATVTISYSTFNE